MHTVSTMKSNIHEYFHKNRASKTFMWVCVGLFPLYLTFAANYISYCAQGSDLIFVLLQDNLSSFIFGGLIVYALFLGLLLLFPKVFFPSLLSTLLWLILPLVDFFKFTIIKEHFLPSDIVFAKNAASFTGFVDGVSIPYELVGILCTTFLYLLFIYFMAPKLNFKWIYRIPMAFLLFGGTFFFVTTPTLQQSYKNLFKLSIEASTNQGTLFKTHGFVSSFILNFSNLNISVPDDYSKSYIETTFNEYLPSINKDSNFQNPDIVVVLSESQWDATTLNGVTLTPDPMANFKEIAKTNISGNLIVPTFGGGTVRPEFEVLTGMTTSALPPGNIPYQQFMKDSTFSYPMIYKNLGYDTIGIHTYQKTFYDRETAYPLMGFDTFLGEYDLNVEHHWNSGPYIADETIIEEIIYQLNQPRDTAVFVQGITMENHSLYRDKYEEVDKTIKVTSDSLSSPQINALENYAAGVSNNDEALKVLYDFVMDREKPTIVLWYGDHLPTLGEHFEPYISTGDISSTDSSQWSQEEKLTMFSTPYLIFSNYDTGKEYQGSENNISPFLLSPLLADYIDAPETLQTNFLLDLYTICPVMSPYYNLYTPNAPKDERERMKNLHNLLTYDLLIGKEYILEMQK